MVATAKKPKPKAAKKAKAKSPKLKKVKAPKPTEAELLNRWKEVEDAEAECQKAASEMVRTKAEAKSAKEFYDNRVYHLRDLIRASINDANRPLFSQNGHAETNGHTEAPKAEAWREVPIEKLACGAAIDGKLKAAKIDTLGALADWTLSGKKLRDIKGVGEGAAETLQNRLDDYWKNNPPDDVPSINTAEAGKLRAAVADSLNKMGIPAQDNGESVTVKAEDLPNRDPEEDGDSDEGEE